MSEETQQTETTQSNEGQFADIANDTLTTQAPEKESTENKQESEPHQKDVSEMSLDELPLPGDEEKSEVEKDIPKWVEKKLSKKDKLLAQKEAEIAQVKAEAERLAQQMQQQRMQAPIPVEQAPQRENYNSDLEYQVAIADYAQEIKLQKIHQTQAEETHKQIQENFKKRLDETNNKGTEKYEDYEDVTDALFKPGFPSNRAMCEAILDSDHASDIMYFLGKYKDKAKEIALMNPIKAIKKIAEIDARFKERKKSNITKAPRMLGEERGQAKAGTWGDPSKMNMDDFQQWYKANYG
jgi:hypothetical protein